VEKSGKGREQTETTSRMSDIAKRRLPESGQEALMIASIAISKNAGQVIRDVLEKNGERNDKAEKDLIHQRGREKKTAGATFGGQKKKGGRRQPNRRFQSPPTHKKMEQMRAVD